MSKSQFDVIYKDLDKIQKTFPKKMAKQAEDDILYVHKNIIENFYNAYPSPSSYRRHHGLRKTIVSHDTFSTRKSGAYKARVQIGSARMNGKYRTSPENIFNMFWEKGLRGLPSQGSSPLEHTFTWFTPNGIRVWHEGETWVNPFWSGKGESYFNEFSTVISYQGIITRQGTPSQIMDDFMEKWEFRGFLLCDELIKQII